MMGEDVQSSKISAIQAMKNSVMQAPQVQESQSVSMDIAAAKAALKQLKEQIDEVRSGIDATKIAEKEI